MSIAVTTGIVRVMAFASDRFALGVIHTRLDASRSVSAPTGPEDLLGPRSHRDDMPYRKKDLSAPSGTKPLTILLS